MFCCFLGMTQTQWGAAHCQVWLSCFGVRACVLSFVLNLRSRSDVWFSCACGVCVCACVWCVCVCFCCRVFFAFEHAGLPCHPLRCCYCPVSLAYGKGPKGGGTLSSWTVLCRCPCLCALVCAKLLLDDPKKEAGRTCAHVTRCEKCALHPALTRALTSYRSSYRALTGCSN